MSNEFDEFDTLRRAEDAFARFDKIKREMRLVESELSSLCTEYSKGMRIWGYRPEMLRLVVEARLGQRKYG